jgi:protein-tyrosine phosphatase
MDAVDPPGDGLGNPPGTPPDDLGKTWGYPLMYPRFPPRSLGHAAHSLWTKIPFRTGSVLAMAELFRVTTVCLGNICRSPMAEVILRDRIARADLPVAVDSGGTGDWHIGYPMDPRAWATLRDHGYDLSEHQARQVHQDWLSGVDLAVTMDMSNYRDVMAIRPTTEVRMFRAFDPTLSHLEEPHPDLEVPDPYYGGDDGFIAVLQMLERAADGLVSHLKQALSTS